MARSENSNKSNAATLADDAVAKSKGLLGSKNAAKAGNKTNNTETRHANAPRPTAEEALNDMEDAMDSLANEPATGMAQRNETEAVIAAEEGTALKMASRTWGEDLDPDLRTAFADARVAEAEILSPAASLHTTSASVAPSLTPDDLVTANKKHWTKAANMAILPPNWHAATSRND